jgi:acetyl-CoA C-acetyltransferase
MTRWVVTRWVIVLPSGTPIGRFGSVLSPCSAVDLGAVAIREAVARAALSPTAIDPVVMGHALQAGAGHITSSQAAIAAGVPIDVPAIALNDACLSSLTAIAYADQLIRLGEIETAIAGGMESMRNAPYLLPRSRRGDRLGDADLVDAMVHEDSGQRSTDSTWASRPMKSTPPLASREDPNAWSARSRQCAPHSREWSPRRGDRRGRAHGHADTPRP